MYKWIYIPRLKKELKYVFCDDWLIFAIDRQKNLYYIITEMWMEWCDLPENADQEKNAIKKYMLPVALKKWGNLRWIKIDEECGNPKFSYLKHYWRRMKLSYFLWYRWNKKNRRFRKLLKEK
jgi:hypothetical protein